MFGLIYLITNKLDGKRYVGQTICSLKKRWREHCNGNSGCTYLSSAIKKYGKDSFEIRILSKSNSMEELNHREAYYIRLFNTLAPNGYNLDIGGKNRIMHEDTRKKLSIAQSRENNGFFGKKHSEETKRKISEAMSGRISPNKGKSHSAETRAKIGAIHRGKIETEETKNKKSASKIGNKNSFFGKKHSEETKRKISEARKSSARKNNLSIVETA